jgi:hypothetical protein
MATTADWDFFNRNVQSGLLEGRYLNAAFTMIAAGPPRLAALSSADPTASNTTSVAFPIGVIQNFNVGQSSQVLRLFEIGSERSYFIRGRTMGTLGLGRVMYHGPSLLRALYAYVGGSVKNGDVIDPLYEGAADQIGQLNTSNLVAGNDGNRYNTNPGQQNIWLDLASDVFSQPIGLMILMRDSNNDTVGAFYFEYCQITNHGFAADSGGTILSENVSIMFERAVPISAVQVVSLIKNSGDLTDIIGGNPAIGSAS